MRKAVYLTLICILSIAGAAEGQTLLGVYDKQTGRPLPGAAVEVGGEKTVIAAGEDGLATLEQAPPVRVEVSHLGYETKQINLTESGEPFAVYLAPEEKMLREIVVTGYEDNRRLLEIPGAVQRLSPEDIERTDETALLKSLNTIPGVRMEQRSPGSYRISIRGSSLRAPFDVRNVKIYWNGVPFTDPNGITPINLLDINQIRNVEVIRGPAASAYGAGTGGVINLETEGADFGEKSVTGAATFGSYQLRRYSAAYESGDRSGNFRAAITRQQSDGYRDHTAFGRTTGQISGRLFAADRHTLSANVFFSDLFYETPGGLTAEQFRENPRQARPGAAEQRASVDYQAFLTSLRSEREWSDRFSSDIAIYGMHSFFEMPFLFDFERETRRGMGGRASLSYEAALGAMPLDLTAGGEYQYMFLEGRNFSNEEGFPDSLRFDDEVASQQSLAFLKADLEAPAGFFVTLGLSYNYLVYDIFRLVGFTEGPNRQISKIFDPIWTPRIGVVKTITPSISVQGSISRGFSPPSVKEIRTGDGILNLGLQPENGVNYEAGVRGSILNNRLDFDITAFSFQLTETIVSYTDSLINTVKFRNTGSTSQLGLEFAGNLSVIESGAGWVERVELGASYARHRFRFKNYIQEGQDYSGNMLTGVAPHTATASLDAYVGGGFYFHMLYSYSDAIPLNDANAVFSQPYHLTDLKLGWEGAAAGTRINAFVGANNMLDETYSLGYDLNAFGERYYQPAAGRNLYFGLKIKYIYAQEN